MSLTLHFHPLASFCQKVLIALYENDTRFEPHVVDLMDRESSAAFRKLWPIAKMPVLRDAARDRTIPESSVIIEYLAQHHPGRTALLPADPDLALRTRLGDRFYDLHVHEPLQKIVGDRLRPAGKGDGHGVDAAKAQLRLAYDMIDADMAGKAWAMGEAFTMADCAAGPPLFFANKLIAFGDSHRTLAAYFDRLSKRPSFARTLEEAKPYLKFFPG
jgi:glutathione S-transferase